VLAARRMVERSLDGFDLYPEKLIGDTAYGTAEMLNWLVNEQAIEPHIPVFDKSQLPTAPSRATTSLTTTRATPIVARPARPCSAIVGGLPCHEPA
jgi:hypothetical protein